MEQPNVTPNLTLNIAELAKILHMSTNTARQLASKHPDRLPPRIDHGGRRVLFLRSTVEKWLEERSAH
jgi:predicted DNA-binding transcriptional regulator AlpA